MTEIKLKGPSPGLTKMIQFLTLKAEEKIRDAIKESPIQVDDWVTVPGYKAGVSFQVSEVFLMNNATMFSYHVLGEKSFFYLDELKAVSNE